MEAEGRLMPLFSFLDISPDAETEAIGMPPGTPKFTNEIIIGNTEMTYQELLDATKAIEKDCGKRTDTRIPLDIDILQHGDTRYHEDDWQRPYVKDLMAMM